MYNMVQKLIATSTMILIDSTGKSEEGFRPKLIYKGSTVLARLGCDLESKQPQVKGRILSYKGYVVAKEEKVFDMEKYNQVMYNYVVISKEFRHHVCGGKEKKVQFL